MTAEVGHLFGLEHAETLWDDIGAAYEQHVDGAYGIDEPSSAWPPVIIEEWTAHPPRHHLGRADTLLERLVEHITDWGEVTEDFGEQLGRIVEHDTEIREAAEALLELIASRITYRMADKVVARHTITWDDDGEPLVDGEPLYRKRVQA